MGNVIEIETFWPDEIGAPRGQVMVRIGALRRRIIAYRTVLRGRPAMVAIGIVVSKRGQKRRLGFVTHWLDTGIEVAGHHPGEGGGHPFSFGPLITGWRRAA
jgi:hypothetical protein